MKVPSTMATQHPDSANKRVLVAEEVDEAILSFRKSNDGLGCDEYLVDYLSKLTPYHQIGQIIRKISEETDLIPGKDVFLTPRLVSSFEEEPFRQLMTLTAIMEGFYHSMKIYGEQGVREIVHAMTSVEELRRCKERAENLLSVIGKELHMLKEGELQIIPLFEGLPELLSLREILPEFIKQVGGSRVFLGKSETALLYGHPASVLALKIALADCHEVEQKLGIELFPLFGGGSLPFRGHITLENSDNFLREYRGTKTYTIQSGMRYDHGAEKTKKLVEKIKAAVEQGGFQELREDERRKILETISIFAKNYLQELSEIVEVVGRVAELVPEQRERLLKSTDVRYYQNLRDIGSYLRLCPDQAVRREIQNIDSNKFVNLPRAITFTSATYTCGLPPEFIGTGNALREIKERMGSQWLERLLEDIFPSLESDLVFASKFLNLEENQNILLTKRIKENFDFLESMVEFEEPDNSYIILSRTANSYLKDLWEGRGTMPQRFALLLYSDYVTEYLNESVNENLAKLMLDMGKIRKSLG